MNQFKLEGVVKGIHKMTSQKGNVYEMMTVLADGQEVPLCLFGDAKGKASQGQHVSVHGILSSSPQGYLQTRNVTIATMAGPSTVHEIPTTEQDDGLPF